MSQMHYGGNIYKPTAAALVYYFNSTAAGTFYLTVNHSTWHTDQDLMLTVNGQQKQVLNVPVYLTLGYWNETQSVEVPLVKGLNTLTFTRLSTSQVQCAPPYYSTVVSLASLPTLTYFRTSFLP